ncbi:membrane progestin receptor beta-like [Patiria miniata]|uniref:Membrane progesterone receptor n=1 Tax=Patiria miniata TaxID=46514 RepID=A0A914A258_PATMI|nr:membrane progestin receptor beta-like [Patiria miniata]
MKISIGYENNQPPGLRAEEVPLQFREPYVEIGYRKPYQPFTFYLKSFFQIHNETLNVWTHAIACVATMFQGIRLCATLDMEHDPYAPMFKMFILSSMIYLFLSTCAHLFQSINEVAHHTCFFIDYMGVSIYSFAAGMAQIHFCSLPWVYRAVESFYLPLHWFLSFLVCFCCSYSKYRYKRPYPFARKVWQMSSVSAGYITAMFPITMRILFQGLSIFHDLALFYQVLTVASFLAGSFFFAAPFPQKFSPGNFDIVGHGHQLFHIFMAFTSYMEVEAVYRDYIDRRSIYSNLFTPTPMIVWGYFILLVIANCIVALVFREKVKARIEREKEE